MSSGEKIEAISKDIGLMHGQVVTMIVKKKLSRVLLEQIRDTLRIIANQIDEVLNG